MSENAPRPFGRLEWMIAGRYLRSRRREGFISVIAGFSLVGIMLGVATLIIVMSVMNGFRTELVDRILGAQAHISVLPFDQGRLEDYDALDADLAGLDGVTRTAPVIERQVLATSRTNNTGVLVRGMRAEDLLELDGVAAPEEASGSLADYGPGLAIGAGIATKLGLRVGDRITLISPRGMTTPFGTKPRTKAYPVAYIFRIGMHQYDSAYVFMPLEEAQAYFNNPNRVDGIEVMVDDPLAIDAGQPFNDAVSRSIESAAAGRGYLWNWKAANGSFLQALDVERNVMFLILALIILVAALNIISGLIMLVKDKGRDLGLLRTMGLTRGAVLRVFLYLRRLHRRGRHGAGGAPRRGLHAQHRGDPGGGRDDLGHFRLGCGDPDADQSARGHGALGCGDHGGDRTLA
ncbi:MAG: ABC transporter permease [Pseudomonadota bacterium]